MTAPRLTLLTLLAALMAAPAPAQETGGSDASGTGTETGAGASPEMETGTDGETGAETGAGAEAGPEGDPLEGLDAGTVIAEIDGTAVTLGELIALRRALPAQYQGLPAEILAKGLTDQLVNQAVLAERARAEGFEDRPDIELALKNLVSSTLADAYMRAELQERVTEAAVEAAYEERYLDAEPVEEIRASHILVEEEARAAELKAEIDGGADFAEVAAEHGTDGTAQRGGDLGWFVREDMVPEFADAAFGIGEVGTVVGPVESPFGFHLIKLTGRRDRPAPPLEEVRAELLEALTEEAQQAILEEAKAAVTVTRRDGDIPAEAVFADDLILPAPAE